MRVDTRESALIQQFDSSFDFVIEPLDIGDIIIEDQDHGIQLVFERKTLSDLSASIKDGRYKEQKHRLLATFPQRCVTYIIEEGQLIAKDAHGLRASVYTGIYTHSMYRDGVHVVFTKNLAETAAWIRNVATKCKENPEKFKSGGEGGTDYLSSRKAKCRKIENIDVQACYKLQLCQIPGVSYKLAESIIDKYPTLMDFLKQLGTYATKQEAVKAVSQLSLIGTKKATTIVEYLRPELAM